MIIFLFGIALAPLIAKVCSMLVMAVNFTDFQWIIPLLLLTVLYFGLYLAAAMKHIHWLAIGCMVVTLLRQGVPTVPEVALVIGLGTWLVRAFRNHYVAVCLAAPLPNAIAMQFRATGAIPSNITPVSKTADFWNALSTWFEYNPRNHELPGVLRSPSGRHSFRIVSAFAFVTLIAVTFPNFVLLQMARNPTLSAFELILGIILLHFAPVLLAAIVLFLYSYPILGKAGGLQRSGTLATYWTELQDDISKSPNTIERDSLMLGHVIADSSPLLPTLKTANSHIWISGSTGAGKTALLMCLLEQYIHRGFSALCLDLKADSFELLHTLSALAQRNSAKPIPLWHFTNRHGWSTQFCSPFTQKFWKALSPAERTTVHLSSMGLGFSRDYGESWFNDATYTVLDHTNQKYPQISSYQELHERILYELAQGRR
jgi:Bacterial protein of unknown function (DUF853)